MRGSVCGFLLLFVSQIQAAPKASPEERLDMLNGVPVDSISSLFRFGEDEVRLWQNYLKSFEQVQGDPGNMPKEKVLFHLFAFYDYDKSSQLDGLEIMKLLADIWLHQQNDQPSHKQVIPLVDELLDKQDLNRDGLLNPSELLAPPVGIHLPEAAGETQHQGPPVVIEPPHVALVNEEEGKDLLTETTTINEGLQGHEASQVAAGALLDQQGSDIPENLEENANKPEGIPQNPSVKGDDEPILEQIENIEIAFNIHEEE
ncbi:cell growth regulator with EF hand domain protein 1 [Rhinatrema bivittatum]|uniref:cell growth regulator with EF hand domain protein 1 n=1 Tax=Rhinatrema bivittatum TaxID=194408 RepID=UPI00112E8DA7|nr:cell growth regulator with EF hand domain protein 1 [Rhinatrema bivittatum]XP_029452176.1 cell growth regulator with EF hand domain protein 1 [Rhinatrema bivittatum]